MKNVVKVAVLAVALAATPALAKEVKQTKDTTVTKEETTTDGATTKTVKKHHHKQVKKASATTTTTTEDNSSRLTNRRFDGSTFFGYPIQANGNPDDARQATRTVKQF